LKFDHPWFGKDNNLPESLGWDDDEDEDSIGASLVVQFCRKSLYTDSFVE
jgi:hypothetical protein